MAACVFPPPSVQTTSRCCDAHCRGKLVAPRLCLCVQINILHLSSNHSHSSFPITLQSFRLKTFRFHSCQVALCAKVIKVGADDVRSGVQEEGMRVLGLRCALPDSNGSEHGLGWLRRVSYPGHSKLPTITKVVNGLLQRLKAAIQQPGVTVLIKGCNGKKIQPCHHCVVPTEG